MEDQNNPGYPYKINNIFTMRAHEPDPPVPDSAIYRRATYIRNLGSISPIAHCIQNPPLLGSDGNYSTSIQIIQALCIGYFRLAQVFVVRRVSTRDCPCLEGRPDMIAKFYDPFYHHRFRRGEEDPFYLADYSYTHECATYQALQDLQGTMIPKFHGSYTLVIPVGRCYRLVRMILMERVDGLSLDKMEPPAYRQEDRQEIMRQIIDTECALFARNVEHGDLYPKNVVVKHGVKPLQVFIIDFGLSAFERPGDPSNGEAARRLFPVPNSPLIRWQYWRSRIKPFGAWIDWNWRQWVGIQFRHTAASIARGERDIWQVPN